MAQIIKITEAAVARIFEVCLADKCPALLTEEHIEEYHRSWTWSLGTEMTEEDMIFEVKLLAASERERLAPPPISTRQVSIAI